MMDSFHRSNERSTKKNRLPPSTKSQTQKISRDGAFNDSEMRLKAILNPTFSNKSQSNPLKQRSTNKRSDSSELSRTNQSISYGKENKSQSPKKRSRSKPANNSMIQTNTSKPSLGNTIKTPNHDRSLNSITPSEKRRKIEHNKIPSGANLNLSGSLHKRTNSSGVGRHSRAFSNERKSSHGLRNVNNISNSVFNNSFAFEDPLNYSREYSYLKEYDTSEFVHLSDLTGLYSSSFKLAGSNDKINNGLSPYNIDNLCSTNNDEEEATVKDPSQNLYRKGKAFFKQKKYPEAAECLKASLQSEGENPEVLFLLGVSYLWLGQYQEAKTELTKLIEKDGAPPKCSVFILLSIVYKKMEDAFSAIKILTKAIMIYPERCDIYIFRAKMYLKLKNWERAISDFRRAAQIDPSRGIAYIGQGDAFRMMAEFDEAVTAYTDAVNLQSPLARIALLKRAIALTELKRYNEAICDLDAIILEDPRHSEAFYFKGLILEKMRDPNEAILCFEQSIKHNTSKKAVTKSLYEITRIKIEEKNFYEAYHTLHRSKMLNLDPSAFRKLTLFTEGVMHLMKKRFDTGVSNLTEVLKYHLAPSLIPMVYSYRAYGNFCSGKIKKALSDYQEVQKLSKLDKTCTYNKLLCEGILAAQADNYDLAQTNFDKALKVYKNKMEPYFYKAVLGIQIFRKSHQKSDKAKLVQVIEATLKLIDKALEINEGCSNLFYVKAVLLYAVEELDLSYSNVQKAVEKADEYYAKYYHLKGAIYAAAGNYYHAISNLSTAISLNKNYRPAYLERAKCYFALCELKQVFLDIQTFTSIKGNDPNIHLWAGNLLFSTGAYEDAARAYSNSENIYKSETLLCLRAKCYLLIKEPSLALKDLTRLVDLQTTSNVHYYIDRECLRSLMIATTPVEASDDLENINVVKAIQTIAKILSYKMSGEIFHLDDLYFYKSVLHFYLQEYEQALDDLDTAWEFRQELNQILKSRKKHNKEEKDHIKIAEEEGAKSSGKKEDGEEDKGYSFTLLEYLYNRGIYLLMDHKYSESCTLFEHLRDQASDPTVKQKAETIIKLIKVQLLKGVKDKDPFNATTKLKTQEFVVFPYMNRLCSLFPSFKLPLSSSTIYETRLSFCFPFVEPPSMAPIINCDILDEITVLSVENRPEAPWIKRSIEGVVFTEDFMQNEEKEITNLKEIIEANGLKEEDVYKSLGGGESKKKLKETHPTESHPTESHQTESAVEEADEIIEYPYEQDPVSKFVPTHELLAHHLSEEKIKMRRSNT